MSLVAYGASDSESSDNESADENIPVPPQIKPVEKDKPLTLDQPCNNSPDDARKTLALPQQTGNKYSDSEEYSGIELSTLQGADTSTSTDNVSVHDLLKGLPIPKPGGPLPDDVNDELEEEVKPKWSQLKDAPKPPKKMKQPVKILLPSVNYDSDEEEQPVKKKNKPSGMRSGLTALLPAPVHVAKKETNRILIPYSMTRKNTDISKKGSKNPSITNTVTSQPRKNVSHRDDSDSDDDTPTNFFSLNSDENSSIKPDFSVLQGSANILQGSANFHIEVDSKHNISKDFVGPSLPSVSQTQRVGKLDLPSPKFDSSLHQLQSTSQDSNIPDVTMEDVCSQSVDEPQAIPDNFMENEQFLRLQGKNKRGREQVNIMDVNADDFISTVDVRKNLSVEQADHSHRKKDNMPSAQQRRKKQITYLAYQAKERELDLKNEWAQNRMTKRQTQSKYGF